MVLSVNPTGLAVAAMLAAAIAAQDAAAVTHPGRTVGRALELFLGGRGSEAVERTLVVVLDPTPAVAAAGFADAFDAALVDNAASLVRTRLGLGIVGERGTIVLAPTPDHAAVAAEIRARLGRATGDIQNVYADLRATATALGGAPGERGMLLVSLENGDAEDDVEQTGALLRRAKVRLSVLTSEAYVADSYWAARPYQDKPRGTTLVGGDAPVIDLPWGWIFQIAVANEVAPSAVGPWGFNRLAALTEGRVHLYASADQTGHQCAIYGTCLFCQGDHLPREEAYWEQRTSKLTPPTSSRKEALAQLGKDVYFRAVLHAWKRAADEGLIRSEPSVRLAGATASPDRQRFANVLDLQSGISFDRQAKRAERAAQMAGEIGDWLDGELQRIGADKGLARQEAGAHFTRLMLQLARANLVSFAAWCRDVAPVELETHGDPLPPPELSVANPEQRPVGIGYSNLCLCHGVRPFLEVDLPGGAALRTELERLDQLVASFHARYGHTQYAFGLHRSGIARFHLTYPGIAGNVPRVRPKSEQDGGPPTTPRLTRPPRGGSSSTGESSGPTTGRK